MPDFFPWWVVITHFLNIFFMVLLFRSGLEVLTALIKTSVKAKEAGVRTSNITPMSRASEATFEHRRGDMG